MEEYIPRLTSYGPVLFVLCASACAPHIREEHALMMVTIPPNSHHCPPRARRAEEVDLCTFIVKARRDNSLAGPFSRQHHARVPTEPP